MTIRCGQSAAMVDRALKELSPEFDKMYSKVGRPSIPPEQLLRALLLQMLYSVRSERLLVEEIDYNILFRWFVGLNLDDEVWDATVFTKNRGPFAGSRSGQRLSEAGGGTSAGAGLGLGGALYGRRKFAGSVGQREEFSAQEQEGFVSAGRSGKPHGELSGGEALERKRMSRKAMRKHNWRAKVRARRPS